MGAGKRERLGMGAGKRERVVGMVLENGKGLGMRFVENVERVGDRCWKMRKGSCEDVVVLDEGVETLVRPRGGDGEVWGWLWWCGCGSVMEEGRW